LRHFKSVKKIAEAEESALQKVLNKAQLLALTNYFNKDKA
jgi:excinuclease ABC subunit C